MCIICWCLLYIYMFCLFFFCPLSVQVYFTILLLIFPNLSFFFLPLSDCPQYYHFHNSPPDSMSWYSPSPCLKGMYGGGMHFPIWRYYPDIIINSSNFFISSPLWLQCSLFLFPFWLQIICWSFSALIPVHRGVCIYCKTPPPVGRSVHVIWGAKYDEGERKRKMWKKKDER